MNLSEERLREILQEVIEEKSSCPGHFEHHAWVENNMDWIDTCRPWIENQIKIQRQKEEFYSSLTRYISQWTITAILGGILAYVHSHWRQ